MARCVYVGPGSSKAFIATPFIGNMCLHQVLMAVGVNHLPLLYCMEARLDAWLADTCVPYIHTWWTRALLMECIS